MVEKVVATVMEAVEVQGKKEEEVDEEVEVMVVEM